MFGVESVFVISRCEDDLYFDIFTEAEMAVMLNDEFAGHRVLSDEFIKKEKGSFFNEFPANSMLIIRGKTCKKEAVEKVVKWKLS